MLTSFRCFVLIGIVVGTSQCAVAERYDPRAVKYDPRVSLLAKEVRPEYLPGYRARHYGCCTRPQQISPYDILIYN